MDIIERYLPYWPVLASAVVFFVLALILFFRGELAMERSPKPLSWVPAYRREESLGDFTPRGGLLPLFGVAGFSLAIAIAYRLISGGAETMTPDMRRVSAMLLACIGAVSAYLLLRQLFGSVLVSLCGSLLFSASYLGSHTALCQLTTALLLLLVWLRQKEKRWFAELLYGAVLMLLVLTAAVTPECAWLLPVPIVLHWIKNIRWLRSGQQGFGRFFGDLGLSLLWWALAAAAFVLLRTPLLRGYRAFFDALTPSGFAQNAAIVWQDMLSRLFAPLERSRLLHPLIDAPMAMLGFFGAISALRMAILRRDGRGRFALLTLGCLALAWLLSAYYALTLGFLLTAGCLLYNCVRGERRAFAVVCTILGVAAEIALYWLAWGLPLDAEIVQRLS